MSSKLIQILGFVLILQLSECEDWCSLIKPGGEYTGLRIFKRWKSSNETDREIVMHDIEDTKEWIIQIDASVGYQPKDLSVISLAHTVKKVNRRQAIRFGYHFISSYHFRTYYGFCEIFSDEDTPVCKEKNTENWPLKKFPDYSQPIVITLYPSLPYYGSAKRFVINKKDRTEYKVYDMVLEKPVNREAPQFILQLSDSLFQRLESVVDYTDDYGKYSGWLLFFEINGRPKYCFTEENKEISDECKSEEKMKSLYWSCFSDTTRPTTSTTDSPIDPNFDRNILIIAIVAIISLIILTFVVVYAMIYFFQKRKGIQKKTTTTTSDTSDQTSKSSVKTIPTKSSKTTSQ